MKRLSKEIEHDIRDRPDNRIHSSIYLLPPPNIRFVGRNDLLDQLEQKFFIDKDNQAIALVGLRGIGKTQTALKFAHNVKVKWAQHSIFRIPSQSRESIEQAFREIAEILKISVDQTEDAKIKVQQHLSNNISGKWLLIVDNVDDIGLVSGDDLSIGIVDFIPQNENGLVLYTTRYQEVATELLVDGVIEIEKMSKDEATSFLNKSLASNALARKDLVNDVTISEFPETLVHLPLAIAQAAAYLTRNRNVSIKDYLRLLQSTEQNMIDLLSHKFSDKTRYKGAENAVAKTWLVSFDQIRGQDQTAADLLSFISCIGSKAIPVSILPSAQSDKRMMETIGTLCAYSFLTRRGKEDVYDMHRLVHLASGIWVQQHEDLTKTAVEAIKHVSEVFPWPKYENLLEQRENSLALAAAALSLNSRRRILSSE